MKPKLLSPAGDWVSLRAAISSGADAVYFGVKSLNMRAGAKNFELGELGKVVSLCHKKKVKAYLCINTIVYENEISKLVKLLKEAKRCKVDAVICWDFAVIGLCEKLKIPIHVSTQASISSFESLRVLCNKFKMIESVNLARELSLEQIKKIVKKSKVKIETFVHGAMCVSVSGRCFLSQEVFGKSANRGECLQPCRRKYIVKDIEEKHEFLLGKDYVLSPKDLCALPVLDKLVESGVNVFKIEGRNRSPEYVKVVTSVYRKVIDSKKLSKKIIDNGLKKLKTVYNRGFHTGFYLGIPTNDDFTKAYGSVATKQKQYVGFVKNFYKKVKVAEIKIETGSLKVGDTVMVQGNKTGVFEQKIKSMQINHKNVKKVKKSDRVGLKVNKVVRTNDKVFIIS